MPVYRSAPINETGAVARPATAVPSGAHRIVFGGGGPTTRDSLILCLAQSFRRLIQLRSFSRVSLFVWGGRRGACVRHWLFRAIADRR